ncbi:MAG TPA: hypothetical protein VHL56_03530 [Candidatus Limnocylindrales bacterium]|jgi:hypothetical protein|nr:hypothetical protein [Candidatus Limnocylindrales bacterium]
MKRWLAATVLAAAMLSGCGALTVSPPAAGPESFPELSGQLARLGVSIEDWTSGDDGCDNPTLAPTSIRFEAKGLDQPTPITLRIYIFRNRDAWEKRQPDVDACVAEWADDPSTFEIVSTSPYILAGQGPWPPGFGSAIRAALTAAAGTGG